MDISVLKTDDSRIESLRPLLSPAILIEELPISDEVAKLVIRTRRSIAGILGGEGDRLLMEDDRLLVVVGPCSIHDPEAALDYANRLSVLAKEYKNDLLIVMRAYFEKPRTTVGWKGLVNDPHLDNSFLINVGVRFARKLLLDIAAIGLPVGTEFLDTITPQFFADLISWGSIGARTSESQVHREMASGLSMPIGFKNSTDGQVQVAIDAVCSAMHPHHFLSITKEGIGAIVATHGNSECHIILRGGKTKTNYRADAVADAIQCLENAGLSPRLMVDCSHGNSGKDILRQVEAARNVAGQIASGNRFIMAVMLESFIKSGRQDISDNMVYGQSVTDPCISWESTKCTLKLLAEAVDRCRTLNA